MTKLNLVEFFAHYKHGPQSIRTTVSTIAQNIMLIEALPEEAPEFLDGNRSIITVSPGIRLASPNSYETLIARWKECLEEAL